MHDKNVEDDVEKEERNQEKNEATVLLCIKLFYYLVIYIFFSENNVAKKWCWNSNNLAICRKFTKKITLWMTACGFFIFFTLLISSLSLLVACTYHMEFYHHTQFWCLFRDINVPLEVNFHSLFGSVLFVIRIMEFIYLCVSSFFDNNWCQKCH